MRGVEVEERKFFLSSVVRFTLEKIPRGSQHLRLALQTHLSRPRLAQVGLLHRMTGSERSCGGNRRAEERRGRETVRELPLPELSNCQ